MKCLGVILLLVNTAFTLSVNSSELNDCISAELLCKDDALCNNSYLTLKNCSKADAVNPLSVAECQQAAKLILQTPMIHCKCRHRMRKEEHCLNIYWTVHSDYIPGSLTSSGSPYEGEIKDHSISIPEFDLFDITDSAPNVCVHEATICGSMEKCSHLKSDYVKHCSATKADGSCDRQKCHNHLRMFIKKIPIEFTKRLLFCPCNHDNKYCGERRRQNIVPKCSFEEKKKKNCLQLYDICMEDNLCKSRLLDYQKQCLLLEKNNEGCSPNQHDLCIKSYIRMIGTAVTPNFINNTSMDTSLWCTCEGSANKLEECNAFLGMFTSNKCLKEVISPVVDQSIRLPVRVDDKRSPTDNRSGTDLDVKDEKERTPSVPSAAASGVSLPSFMLLSPALFVWLKTVVSFI